MKSFPIDELKILNGYESLFRKYWYSERLRLKATFVDFDGNFREFLRVVFIFWQHDLVRND